VARVGLLAKGLFLRDDRDLELVVLCGVWPTCQLLTQVVNLFRQQIRVLRFFAFTCSSDQFL